MFQKVILFQIVTLMLKTRQTKNLLTVINNFQLLLHLFFLQLNYTLSSLIST